MQCIYHNFQDNQPWIPDLGKQALLYVTPFVFYPSNAAIFTIWVWDRTLSSNDLYQRQITFTQLLPVYIYSIATIFIAFDPYMYLDLISHKEMQLCN